VEHGGEFTVALEEFFRLLGVHPALKDSKLFGIFLDFRQGHLVGSPKALKIVAFNFARRRPALR
jgi:hypothetical protein